MGKRERMSSVAPAWLRMDSQATLMLIARAYASAGTGHLMDDPDILTGIEPAESTYVYDRSGEHLLARFECQNREAVTFGDLPDRWTVLGVTILIASAVYISIRERQVKA